jgi:hypothetical protein
MNEQIHVHANRLRAEMDRETALFTELGLEMEKLRDSFQAKHWITGLAVTERIQGCAARIEQAESAREAAFRSLRDGLGGGEEAALSAVLPRLPESSRTDLERSWRDLRASVVRLKTASGRLRYAADALGGTLTKLLEAVFPQRKGRIYSRKGTATAPSGALLVDRKL